MITVEQLPNAVEQCRQEQAKWRELSIKERLRAVDTFRHRLAADCDTLCNALKADTGKPAQESLAGEILPLADACLFLQKQAKRILKPRKFSTRERPLWMMGQKDVLHRRPRGIIGIIGTWNYPIMLNGVQIVQSLVAGNGVVWKPSEVAPKIAEALHRFFIESGIPESLFVRMEATREGGPALVEADIDHLVFTGGAGTGRRIAARLGERLISSTMELSGHDALYVLADADVDMAAKAAWFGMTLNRGQTCLAVRRAFVHQSVVDGFTEKLKKKIETAKPMELAMPEQVGQAQTLVDEVVNGGGQAIRGSENEGAPPRHFPPTVLLNVPTDAAMLREATFAPLMAVFPFDDLKQAMATDRLCPYALGASIFTNDMAQAEAIAKDLPSGAVCINDAIAPTAHPVAPFGGNGDSGWGVTQGTEGLLEMTVPQVVSQKKGTFRPHFELGDGDGSDQEALVRSLLEASHGSSVFKRIRGFWRTARNMKSAKKE